MQTMGEIKKSVLDGGLTKEFVRFFGGDIRRKQSWVDASQYLATDIDDIEIEFVPFSDFLPPQPATPPSMPQEEPEPEDESEDKPEPTIFEIGDRVRDIREIEMNLNNPGTITKKLPSGKVRVNWDSGGSCAQKTKYLRVIGLNTVIDDSPSSSSSRDKEMLARLEKLRELVALVDPQSFRVEFFLHNGDRYFPHYFEVNEDIPAGNSTTLDRWIERTARFAAHSFFRAIAFNGVSEKELVESDLFVKCRGISPQSCNYFNRELARRFHGSKFRTILVRDEIDSTYVVISSNSPDYQLGDAISDRPQPIRTSQSPVK